MLCPKCNSEMPENGKCPVCDTAPAEEKAEAPVIEEAAAEAPAPEAPKAEPAPALPSSPVRKGEYIKHYASDKAKRSILISRILAGVCAALFLLGAVITLNTSIDKIPMMSLFLDKEDVLLDVDGVIDEMDDYIDAYEDDLSKKEIKVIENVIDKAENYDDNPSLSNLTALFGAIEELSDENFDGLREYDVDDDVRIIIIVMDTICVMAWISAIIFAGFSLLAGFTLARGWAIVAIILNVIPGIAFVGFWHFALVAAGLIALAVFIGGFVSEFKSFNYLIKNNK